MYKMCQNICNDIAVKRKVSISQTGQSHSNQSSEAIWIKTLVPAAYRCYILNLVTTGLVVSEITFENVDGRTDGRWIPAYTISSPVSR